MKVMRKLLCALGVLIFVGSFFTGTSFANASSEVANPKGVVTPQAYTENVINYVRNKQSKTWAHDWEDYAASEVGYKDLNFLNGYRLDSISISYTDSTCDLIAGCTRYKIQTYNYSTY
ncbi:hypothetical protein UY456_14390 [Paenibacillus polymyxa]|uniref:hypothetical protein n=1 Tax=Paenibacillus polymyxa TaxID=1406 RepID=UPI002AB47F0A|nr:hypothetical protein [Paenibacillus polymyxa]MDY8094186.1 hypothetical protein [Paenibacillus polymyxa]